jgi:hypothetical protein
VAPTPKIRKILALTYICQVSSSLTLTGVRFPNSSAEKLVSAHIPDLSKKKKKEKTLAPVLYMPF